jgi:hypothetical protein
MRIGPEPTEECHVRRARRARHGRDPSRAQPNGCPPGTLRCYGIYPWDSHGAACSRHPHRDSPVQVSNVRETPGSGEKKEPWRRSTSSAASRSAECEHPCRPAREISERRTHAIGSAEPHTCHTARVTAGGAEQGVGQSKARQTRNRSSRR